jgi:hypothetical protein
MSARDESHAIDAGFIAARPREQESAERIRAMARAIVRDPVVKARVVKFLEARVGRREQMVGVSREAIAQVLGERVAKNAGEVDLIAGFNRTKEMG